MSGFSTLDQLWNRARLGLLVELQHAGSLPRAAAALHMSQPTASQHLLVLEAAVGQPLVDRGGRSLRLTDAGRSLAAHAAEVLATLEVAEQELSARAGLQAGTIRLGACRTVLPRILACFAERFPLVTIELQIGPSAEITQRLIDGRVQLAVSGGDPAGDQIMHRPFLDDEIVGIASPGAIPARGGRVQPDRLRGQRLLVREAVRPRRST
ncbi:MAG: LysR family transcriptional regulator [Acidobacteriota bacterium]|nr:LysR family transcriptional regulator [Acidobacteriota bacterium]